MPSVCPRGARLHTLRHSHASVLLANGVDLATVSARLGHSSVRVTADVYSAALRGRDREDACRWDELMGRTRSQGLPKPVDLNFLRHFRTEEHSDATYAGK